MHSITSVCLSVNILLLAGLRKNGWMDLDEIFRLQRSGEPNLDHSPDLGPGLSPEFWLLAGYLKNMRTLQT